MSLAPPDRPPGTAQFTADLADQSIFLHMRPNSESHLKIKALKNWRAGSFVSTH
jgi:hypothetical protein